MHEFFRCAGDEIEVQKFLLDKKRSTHKIEDEFTEKFARVVDCKCFYLSEIDDGDIVLHYRKTTVRTPVPSNLEMLKLWVAKERPTYNDLRQKLHAVPLLSQ